MRKLILFIGIGFCLTSCLGVKGLQRKINTIDDVELGFLNTSKKVEKINQKVQLYINDNSLDTISNVVKNKKSFFTLLLFYTYKNDYQIHFGKESLNTKYIDFLGEELNEETNRSGVFDFNNDANYKLYLDVEEFDFQYNYYDSYFALILPYVSFSNQVKRLTPEVSKIKIKATFKDEFNQVVYEKYYIAEGLNTKEAESLDLYSNKKTHTRIMYNFEESISQNSKDVIYKIIDDLNVFFMNK